MGEHGPISVALVLQAAAGHLQERAVILLKLAASSCLAEPRTMGSLQIAAGHMLRAAGEFTVQSVQDVPSGDDAKAWHLARLERLAEAVGHADEALGRAAVPAGEAAARLENVGLPLALERGLTRKILRALETLRAADVGRKS